MDTTALQIELEYTLKMAALIEEKNEKIAKHMASKLDPTPSIKQLPATIPNPIVKRSKVSLGDNKVINGPNGTAVGLPKTPLAQRQGTAMLEFVSKFPEGVSFKSIKNEFKSLSEQRVRNILTYLRNDDLVVKVNYNGNTRGEKITYKVV